MPVCRAASRARAAAHKSWIATPTDLNSVIWSAEVRPTASPMSTGPNSAARCSSPMRPARNGRSRSPASSSAETRWSTTTRARRTVAAGTSARSGWKIPTALIWVPGRTSRSSKTGAFAVVAVQTMSASRTASAAEAAGST